MSSQKKNGKLTFINVGALKKGEISIPKDKLNSTKHFEQIQQNPDVKRFMKDFGEWNIAQEKHFLVRTWQRFWEFVLSFFKIPPSIGALDALNNFSFPYIDFQEFLASRVEKYLHPGSVILDLGCGRLDFTARLMKRRKKILKISNGFLPLIWMDGY
jgi:hypothetical protein